MRICSLLPSATEIVAQLGLADSLVGVSEECAWPPEVASKPRVTAARIKPAELSSLEIDAAVRASLGEAHSLYTVDAELIEELQPDLLITQDLCTVCAVSSDDLREACPVVAEVISLDPRTLAEVADTVTLLGERLGAQARALGIVNDMHSRIEQVREATADLPRPRVFVAEWIEPPFSGGHWIPEMVEAAGGVDVLARHGEPSFATTWEAVRAADPELVVVAPCGFHVEEAAARAAELELGCRVVAVDADSYFSRPAPRLAEGVQQLGHLLHPEAVGDPGLPAIELQLAA